MERQPGRSEAADGSRPFTLVLCTLCRDGRGADVTEVLRRAVRQCSHGVMVTTGCLSRFLDCREQTGVYAAVQPCTVQRRPTGPATRLGPMVTEDDATRVADWLRAGMPRGRLLPNSLRAAAASRRTAGFN